MIDSLKVISGTGRLTIRIHKVGIDHKALIGCDSDSCNIGEDYSLIIRDADNFI